MEIKAISWEETIPIRQQVLWPNESPEYCKVDGDEDALHFGIFITNQLTCVASLYLKGRSARLRKFATLHESQGKGLGSLMLNHIIKELKASGITYFWFDARESATPFYSRFGFNIEGERFYKNNVSYFKMYMDL